MPRLIRPQLILPRLILPRLILPGLHAPRRLIDARQAPVAPELTRQPTCANRRANPRQSAKLLVRCLPIHSNLIPLPYCAYLPHSTFDTLRTFFVSSIIGEGHLSSYTELAFERAWLTAPPFRFGVYAKFVSRG